MLPPSMAQRMGGRRLAFDEYYRCYPVAMMPGPERETANHGGKIFMSPSALDKLTRLHITYPMLFELINGAKERVTHAGVLEFIAEEGKIYLPNWVSMVEKYSIVAGSEVLTVALQIMQTLLLEPGDLLQIKSTDLPSGTFIKLQPQSTAFLDISDPKAVLENVMRNFSCLTKGDIFSFAYNDEIYEMAVLEVKPQTKNKAISVLETDLEVDFAPPVGYVEPTRADRTSGTSTPRSGVGAHGVPAPGTIHYQGTMAQAINYSSIAPPSTASTGTEGSGARSAPSHFQTGGQKLSSSKKASKANATPTTSTGGVASTSSSSEKSPSQAPSASAPSNRARRTAPARSGPQPLRLPPGKLFFGYEIKPVQKRPGSDEINHDEQRDDESGAAKFQGAGHSLRAGGTKRKGGGGIGGDDEIAGGSGGAAGSGNTSGRSTPSRTPGQGQTPAPAQGVGHGEKDSKKTSLGSGRTLRDFSGGGGGSGR